MKEIAIHRGHYPFVRFLAALLCGIILGHLIRPSLPVFAGLTIAGLALMVATLTLMIAVPAGRQPVPVVGGLFLLMLLAGGWFMVWDPDPAIDRSHFSHHEAAVLSGYISDEPRNTGGPIRFRLAVRAAGDPLQLRFTSGKLLVTLETTANGGRLPAYGDEVIIPARYREIPSPYNPGETDYQAYFRGKAVRHQTYLQRHELYRTGRFGGNRFVAFAWKLRGAMVEKLNRYIPHQEAGAVAATLLLGYRADLDQELLNAYAATGTIHILSVSGMHVAILFWLLSAAVPRAGRRFAPLRFIVLTGFIWMYATLTGLAPSAVRAALMISFVMAADTFGRTGQAYNSIAASAFVLLLWDVTYAVDIGFRLSYLAVLGIVCFYPLIKAWFSVSQKWLAAVWNYMALSIGAQLGAFPLAIHYFHQFPVYFLPANLLVVLPVTGVMWVGIALLLSPVQWLSALLGRVLAYLVRFTNGGLYLLESFPGSLWEGIWIQGWEILLMYLTAVLLLTGWHYRNRRWLLGGLCGLLLLAGAAAVRQCDRIYRRELVIYNVGNELAIGAFAGGKPVVYSSLLSADDRRIRYRVMPDVIRHSGRRDVVFVQEKDTLQTGDLYIRSPVIQFGSKRIVICDGKKPFRYGQHIRADALLLRHNPSVPLDTLTRMVQCNILIADASNSAARLAAMQREAAALDLPLYLLKDNFAYVWKF